MSTTVDDAFTLPQFYRLILRDKVSSRGRLLPTNPTIHMPQSPHTTTTKPACCHSGSPCARACGERAVWLHPLSRHDVQGSTVLSLSDYMQCLLQVFRKKIKVYFMINLTPMTQVIITRWYLVCYWFQHFHHLTHLENLKYPKTGNPWLYFFNSTEVSSSTSNSP